MVSRTIPFVFREQLCKGIKDKICSVFLDHSGAPDTTVLDRLNVTRFVTVTDHNYQVIGDITECTSGRSPRSGWACQADRSRQNP